MPKYKHTTEQFQFSLLRYIIEFIYFKLNRDDTFVIDRVDQVFTKLSYSLLPSTILLPSLKLNSSVNKYYLEFSEKNIIYLL